MPKGGIMKVLAFVALLAGLTTPAFGIDMTVDPGGFFGIHWNTHIGDIPRLELVKDGHQFKTYAMPGSPPVIGGVQAEKILYRFYKGRLESVQVRYMGRQAHRHIIAWAAQQFGPIPFTDSRAVEQVTWLGTETNISLRYNAVHDEGILLWNNRSLESELLSETGLAGGG